LCKCCNFSITSYFHGLHLKFSRDRRKPVFGIFGLGVVWWKTNHFELWLRVAVTYRFGIVWCHTTFSNVDFKFVSRFRCHASIIIFCSLLPIMFYILYFCLFYEAGSLLCAVFDLAVTFVMLLCCSRVDLQQWHQLNPFFVSRKYLQLIQVYFAYVRLDISLISFIMTYCFNIWWWLTRKIWWYSIGMDKLNAHLCMAYLFLSEYVQMGMISYCVWSANHSFSFTTGSVLMTLEPEVEASNRKKGAKTVIIWCKTSTYFQPVSS
jgi:hypothetical protein